MSAVPAASHSAAHRCTRAAPATNPPAAARDYDKHNMQLTLECGVGEDLRKKIGLKNIKSLDATVRKSHLTKTSAAMMV